MLEIEFRYRSTPRPAASEAARGQHIARWSLPVTIFGIIVTLVSIALTLG